MACDSGRQRPAIGIVPMGTANDFATSCHLPTAVNEALRFAANAEAFPVDIIRINNHHFLNIASSGFGEEVTAATPPEMKRILGGATYSLMGVIMALNLRPHDGELVLPDSVTHKGSVLIAAVGNGRQAGGGRVLTPKAYIDDGLLDILLIRHFPLAEFGVVIQELSELPVEGRYVSYIQTPWAEFFHRKPINVNLDGEPRSFKNGRIEVISKVLNLVLPVDCPLLLPNKPTPDIYG